MTTNYQAAPEPDLVLIVRARIGDDYTTARAMLKAWNDNREFRIVGHDGHDCPVRLGTYVRKLGLRAHMPNGVGIRVIGEYPATFGVKLRTTILRAY